MGEGIILNENNAKGIIIKGINLNDGVNLEFLRKKNSPWKFKQF